MKEGCPKYEFLPDHLASEATSMFNDVSKKFPASVPHQAAQIALDCHSLGIYQPQQLGEALLMAPGEIMGIAREAAVHHKSITGKSKIPRVSVKTVTDIIYQDFSLAEQMMTLPSEELEKFILTFRRGEPDANLAMKGEALALVSKYKRKEFYKKTKNLLRICKRQG